MCEGTAPVKTRMRMRCAAVLTVALLALALAPLSAAARAATPVLTASSAGNYSNTVGSGCADLQSFFFSDAAAAVINSDPAVFGFVGAAADSDVSIVNGSYVGTSMGQRVFSIGLAAAVIVDGQYSSVNWEGVAALKCLSGGAMQFAFKPQSDGYLMGPVNAMDLSACGGLGGNARLIATINPTSGAFDFAVYAPVTLHPLALNDCER